MLDPNRGCVVVDPNIILRISVGCEPEIETEGRPVEDADRV